MKLLTPWKKLPGLALDFFFPRWCLGCGREGDLLCLSCRHSLPPLLAPFCARCGRPLTLEPCPTCSGWKMEIDGIRSPFRFEGLMRQAILGFKYQNLKALAQPLAELLEEYLKARPLPLQLVVPVPLHPKRLRQRGYNQSELLAQELGRLLGWPVVTSSLTRQRNTPPQARTAAAEERRANVARAFTCRDDQLQGKGILLIDDVCTTGATLDAAASALKAVGRASVWGLALAREI